MNTNKLGAHVCYPRGYAGPLRHADGAPTVVKAHGDVSASDAVDLRQRTSPETLIVVRFHGRIQRLSEEAAHGRYMELRERMRVIQTVAGVNVAFEFENERRSEEAVALAGAEAVWLEDMHREGLRAVIGNWAVGNPQPEHAPLYAWVVSHLNDGDLLGMHDYLAYPEDIDNPWYCGRWRLPWQAAWINDARIVITEWGRDVIDDRRNHGKDIGQPGWKQTTDAAGILADAAHYNEAVLSDDRVIGATWFQLGAPSSWGWDSFDASEPFPTLVASYSGSVTMPQPSPVLLPIPAARISQPFGANASYYAQYGYRGHNGVDLAAPHSEDYLGWHGTPVQSVSAGRAVQGYSDGYGLYVYVYSDAEDWLYAHLADVVRTGDVQPGTILGLVGYTGNTEPRGARGTHLHWARRPKPYALQNGYGGYADPLTKGR